MTTAAEIQLAVEKMQLGAHLTGVVLHLLQETLWVRPTPRELALRLHQREVVVCWSCRGDPKAGDWCYDLATGIIEDIP